MVIQVQEDDAGTKKVLEDALKRTTREFKEGKDIKQELDRIWRKIRDDAEVICPKDTGTLANTIRITSLPTGFMTGTWSRIKEISIYDRTIVAGDITKINPKSKRPCDYAAWVHDGHRMKDGKIYAGVPFLTQAIAQNERELDEAIDRALRKIGKKFGSS